MRFLVWLVEQAVWMGPMVTFILVITWPRRRSFGVVATCYAMAAMLVADVVGVLPPPTTICLFHDWRFDCQPISAVEHTAGPATLGGGHS